MGRRPWAFWMIERGLSHQPPGEAGQLRLIKQLDLYRDDAEKEFVRKRLADDHRGFALSLSPPRGLTSRRRRPTSVIGGKADMARTCPASITV